MPADELPQFNAHVVAIISVVEAFRGPEFIGSLDPVTLLPTNSNRDPLCMDQKELTEIFRKLGAERREM